MARSGVRWEGAASRACTARLIEMSRPPQMISIVTSDIGARTACHAFAVAFVHAVMAGIRLKMLKGTTADSGSTPRTTVRSPVNLHETSMIPGVVANAADFYPEDWFKRRPSANDAPSAAVPNPNYSLRRSSAERHGSDERQQA